MGLWVDLVKLIPILKAIHRAQFTGFSQSLILLSLADGDETIEDLIESTGLVENTINKQLSNLRAMSMLTTTYSTPRSPKGIKRAFYKLTAKGESTCRKILQTGQRSKLAKA